MLQVNGSLFSIYPTGVVGLYGSKATSIKDFTFLKIFNFFDFLVAYGPLITQIAYDLL